jgi:hypothetical protein
MSPTCQEDIIVGDPCGEPAEWVCLEDKKYYCRNCKVLKNINGMGEDEGVYHFKRIKEVSTT